MTRTDPHQARARELAREAGLDPDARVERPGQRSMPLWCTFRDAARKEHLAREAAATAASIAAATTQAPEFRNAPLKVFGQHDAATVAQMKNCMTIGNVVGGVICADGHLGYAQPVGGVIAYEKQISISGVGFDIGCGNMAVRLDTPYSAIARPRRPDHPGRGADDLVRRRPHQRGACRARAVRRRRCVARVRHGGLPAEGGDPARHRRLGQPLCRPDARRGRASSGSACISAAAVSATPARRAISRPPAARTA